MKQSIYRFRMARPEIFTEKYYTYAEDGEFSERIDLNRNFRSRREVLTLTNDIFYSLMKKDLGGVDYTEEEALYFGAEYYGERDPLYQPEILLTAGDKDVISDLELENANALEASRPGSGNRGKEAHGIPGCGDPSPGAQRKGGYLCGCAEVHGHSRPCGPAHRLF